MTELPRPHLLMVGMSNLDHIWRVDTFPPTSSRTHASAYRVQGGGPAATAAVAAARLRAQVELLSVHGNDDNGHHAKTELERYGVDCSQLHTVLGAVTPVSAVLVTADGERFIFPYRDISQLDSPEAIDLSRLTGVDCVLCDARYPAMSEVVLKEARRQKIPVVADFGSAQYWHLARFADYLIVSEECAGELSENGDLVETLARLKQFDGQLVGISLGARGFLYDEGGAVSHIPAFPVKVSDTTGAGDVFHGAYAYAVACNWDSQRCALFASATAALSCEGLGRTVIPTKEEVERLLRHTG